MPLWWNINTRLNKTRWYCATARWQHGCPWTEVPVWYLFKKGYFVLYSIDLFLWLQPQNKLNPLYKSRLYEREKKSSISRWYACVFLWWVWKFSQSIIQSVSVEPDKPLPSVFCQMLKSASLSTSCGEYKRTPCLNIRAIKMHTLSKPMLKCQYAA